MHKKKSIGWWIPLLLSIATLLVIVTHDNSIYFPEIKTAINATKKDTRLLTPIIPNSSPTPTPSAKPLTFAQMNSLYGPCTNTTVLSYHHIQSEKDAVKNNQVSLSTFTENFEKQLMYYQKHNYQTIDIATLIAFFNNNATIPVKSIILTFDDGYRDFYLNAFPLLQKYNFKAVVFLPTGLVNNEGYLTWEEILIMGKSGLIYFGNHTWSHYATIKDEEKIIMEIRTADTQLSERGLNTMKVFAYPYGAATPVSQNYLKSINYNLAFTTKFGRVLCAKNSLTLPRVRAGNLMPDKNGLN